MKKWCGVWQTVCLVGGISLCMCGIPGVNVCNVLAAESEAVEDVAAGSAAEADDASGAVAESASADESGITKDESKYRVGSVVSDAYVDASEYEIAEKDLKDMNYEYDRDSLTYELVWSDEFDYEGAPDPEKWGYDVGGSGWGNHELQYYTEGDNVTVADGVLTIELRAEEMEGMDYTSTRLVTKNKGGLALL